MVARLRRVIRKLRKSECANFLLVIFGLAIFLGSAGNIEDPYIPTNWIGVIIGILMAFWGIRNNEKFNSPEKKSC